MTFTSLLLAIVFVTFHTARLNSSRKRKKKKPNWLTSCHPSKMVTVNSFFLLLFFFFISWLDADLLSNYSESGIMISAKAT